MKALKVAAAVFLATSLLGAAAGTSASAAPTWFVKKGGVYAKVTTAITVELEAKNAGVTKTAKGGYWGLNCTASSAGGGAIESEGAGKLTSFLNVSGCEPAKEGEGIRMCLTLGSWKAANLSWKTELYSEGTEHRARFASGGAGTPAFEFECNGAPNKCLANTSLHLTNTATGTVEAVYDSKSHKTECTPELKEAGTWHGTLVVKPTAAEKAAGVEAIKVE